MTGSVTASARTAIDENLLSNFISMFYKLSEGVKQNAAFIQAEEEAWYKVLGSAAFVRTELRS